MEIQAKKLAKTNTINNNKWVNVTFLLVINFTSRKPGRYLTNHLNGCNRLSFYIRMNVYVLSRTKNKNGEYLIISGKNT